MFLSKVPVSVGLILSALLLCGIVGDARAVVVDDFEVGPFSIARPADTFIDQTGLDPEHVVGGQRRPIFDIGTLGTPTLELEVTPGTDDGASIHLPAGARLSWTTAYLDDVNDIDFTTDGHDAFQVTVSAAPASGVSVGFFAANDPIPGTQSALMYPISGPGQYLFPFADFQPYSGQVLPDFGSLDALALYVNSTDFTAVTVPTTVTISDVRTVQVPEPATFSAALATVLLFCRRGRRGRAAR